MLGARSPPAVLLRNTQAEQRRPSGGRALVGTFVRKSSEYPLGFLPGANTSAARGLHLGTGPQLINPLDPFFRRGVVEELPVDHDHGREITRRVALHMFQCDLAVCRGLVVADP